jgi:predicted AAA+ superfamily ATPase
MYVNKLHLSGVDDNQIQFYNFEDPDVFALGDWKQIYDHIKVQLVPEKMNYIFLDEVQNVETFERLVDGLFIKKNCDVYITGSNAYFLSGELATLLTGRSIEIEMYTYSFKEYVEFINKNEVAIDSDSNPLKLTKSECFADYIYYGGIPEANNLLLSDTSASYDFVNSVLKTIIQKDIYQRHSIKNPSAFEKVIDFIFDSVGSIVSPNSIANSLTSAGTRVNNETIANYLSYLSESLLIYKVPRYNIKGKRLLQTLDKYYVVDSAYRRVRLGRLPDVDTGHLLENAVYFELRRRNKTVHIGKVNNNEIDFIAVDWDGYTSYYQVAQSTFNPEVLERELRPLKAIGDSNPKYLLTMDIDGDPVYDGIRKLNVADWMLSE